MSQTISYPELSIEPSKMHFYERTLDIRRDRAFTSSFKNNNALFNSRSSPAKMEHGLIGVSPFNGYFSVHNMEILFDWAKDNFHTFDVFTMDKASKYNLMAMGYEEHQAIKKTKKQDQHLYNKIIRCLTSVGFSEEESKRKILLFSQLCGNERYIQLYEKCRKMFKKNADFHADCLKATKEVITGKMDDITPESVAIAVNYLLEELPVWFDANSIFNIPCGTLIYKDIQPSIYRLLYKYDLLSPNQKILAINVEKFNE